MKRRMLLATAATGAIALGAGCRPGSTEPQGPGSSSAEPLPNGGVPSYIPFDGPEPDLPGTADGVVPAYFSYPESVDREGFPLPEGASFTGLMQGVAPTVAPSANDNYPQTFTTIGTSFEMVYAGYATDYLSKFQTSVAGNDLPDMVMVPKVPQMPAMLEKSFSDLTPFLAGDNIKKYPALANIATPAWQIATVGGKLWGVPQPRPPAGLVVSTSQKEIAARGLGDGPITVRDGGEFLDLLGELTDRDNNTFALGADPIAWLMPIVQTMVGTPNVWKVEGGTFIHEIETEEMKEALARATEIVSAGYLHPQSFSDPTLNQEWWKSGVTALYCQSFAGWSGLARANPDMVIGNLELPAWDGSGSAQIRLSAAGYTDAFTGIRLSDDARVDQLLKVMDYFASPIGTSQNIESSYGIEDYSFEWVDGVPTRIPDTPPPAGQSYIGGQSFASLSTGGEEMIRAQHDYLSRAIPAGLANPALGLYSETEATKNASFAKTYSDKVRSILQGRDELNSWDDFVDTWRSQLGEKMAAEYAEAAADAS